jgi:ABC-2 type transport system ATP-binding protein
MSAIEIKDFGKNYDSLQAVKGVSLLVEKGELFGLIGPDGAGKTTLMRSVCTLLKPTSGQILVNNLDTAKDIISIRKILGYMPQQFSLYQDLTVEQNLNFFADLFKVPEEERARRMVQLYRFSRLEPFKKRQSGALSGGMKQKLALSCALIHTPEILILDEPTFGVDPVSREEFWDILAAIRKEGTTILVSTAYMDEAALCDRVALMHLGEFLTMGTPAEVVNRFPFPLYRVTGENLRSLRQFFLKQPNVHATQLFGDALHVSFTEAPPRSAWRGWRQESGGNLKTCKRQPPSIEDVFMELTRKGDDGASN